MTGILGSLASILPKIDPQLNGHVDPQVEVQDSCNCCTGGILCCLPFRRVKHKKDCPNQLELNVDVKLKELLK